MSIKRFRTIATLITLLCLVHACLGASGRVLVFQQGLDSYGGCKDVLLSGVQPTFNYGGHETITSGGVPWGGVKNQILIQFDSIFNTSNWGSPNLVDKYGVVLRATLRLYAHGVYTGSTGIRFTAWPMETPWVEGTSSGTQQDGSSCFSWRKFRSDGNYAANSDCAWGTDGLEHLGPVSDLDYDKSAGISIAAPDQIGWVEFDLTRLVQQWHTGQRDNLGVYIHSDGYWDYFSAHSSEYASDASLRPQLVIDYAPMAVGRGGQIPSAIIVDADYTHADVYAACELADYVHEMTGLSVPILQEIPGWPMYPGSIILGNQPRNATLNTALQTAYPLTGVSKQTFAQNWEAIALDVDNGFLRITGNCASSVVYGANAWLESLGVRWFISGDNGDYVPTVASITFDPCYTVMHAPSMALRGGGAGDTANAIRWHGNLNRAVEPADAFCSLYSGHTYQYILPKSTWFDTHPEWFAVIDGVRGGGGAGWQVCFTNTDGAAQAAQPLIAAISTAVKLGVPMERIRVWVSPNDSAAKCECVPCQAIRDNDGSYTSCVINFANNVIANVRAVYPEAICWFLAYNNHTSLPDHVSPDAWVVPNMTFWPAAISVKANFTKPMFSDTNYKFRDWFYDYIDITDGMSVYTYYGHYEWYTPFPMLTQIAHDIPIMAAEPEFYGMYSETHMHWGTQLMTFYLHHKLMWDAALDVPTLLADYYDKCFGAAATDIENYFTTLQTQMDNASYVGGGFSQIPVVLTPTLIDLCNGIINDVATLIPSMTDPGQAWRTQLVIDGWTYSAKTGRAMNLFNNFNSTADDRDTVVNYFGDILTFADTEYGSIVFENPRVHKVLDGRYDTLAMPLKDLPIGTHAYSDYLPYGGSIKFHTESKTGFSGGIWGINLSAYGTGVMTVPLGATAGATLTDATVSLGLTSYVDSCTLSLSVIDAGANEYVLASDAATARSTCTIPAAVFDHQPLTLKLTLTNPGSSTIIAITNWTMDLTAQAKTVPENCPDVIAMGYALAGDLNGDCLVDIYDMRQLADSWLCQGGIETCTGDLDDSGVVNLIDFAMLNESWGQCNIPGDPACQINWPLP